MYISKKPTIFIIDGHNFVRSCLMADPSNEEEITKEFLDYIDEISQTQEYGECFFRIVFDGGYRPVGMTLRRAMKVTFAEDLSADEVIFESAKYTFGQGKRVAVITSDRGLEADVKSEGIKTMSCQKFYNMLRKVL